jgi:hypothetical protein
MRLTRQSNYAIRTLIYCAVNDPGLSRVADIAKAHGISEQERGAIDEAVSFTSFDRSTRGAPLRPAPFQRRGCELPLDLLDPR